MLCAISIQNVRNLGSSDVLKSSILGKNPLAFCPSACTVVIGENSSGKTALLESIYLLSRGKTFRHHQPKHYIAHGQDTCTIWAKKTDGETLAIAKHKDATTSLKKNGLTAQTQAALTEQLPTLLIDPSSMEMLGEGAAARRQLLDWLCFHTDPMFYRAWLGYQKLLKQRNALLKHLKPHQTSRELNAWDTLISQQADTLHQSRLQAFTDWQMGCDDILSQLLPHRKDTLTLSYEAGFDPTVPLKDTLKNRLNTDIELGYTRVGAHRADIDIAITLPIQTDTLTPKKDSAIHVLSRGEKKLLITALKLAGLPLVCARHSTTPLVLIDDITSELDERACKLLLQTVLSLPCQVFITSLTDDILDILTTLTDSENLAVFGIKDGGLHTFAL